MSKAQDARQQQQAPDEWTTVSSGKRGSVTVMPSPLKDSRDGGKPQAVSVFSSLALQFLS